MAAVPHTSSALPSGRQLPLLRLLKAGPESQVGTPVRVFMLVILLAAVGAGLGLFVLAPSAPVAEPKVIVPFKDRKKAGAAAPAAQAAAAPTPAAAKAAPAAKAAAAPAPVKAAPAPEVPAVAAPPKPDDGLPAKLSAALNANRVVVAAVYAPDSSVAVMARGEAEAGAKAAGVGFVALNVYVPKEIDELAAKLGVLSDPTVLVFDRDRKVTAMFTGFADRELVAQAAANGAK